MNYEYLIFNGIVLLGPLALSFDKKVHFFTQWPIAFPAIGLSLLPFIVWDIVVTGKHWWFNEQFTCSLRIAGLPLGEWLFFITVPYAILFVWECLNVYYPSRSLVKTSYRLPIALIGLLIFIVGISALMQGKYYTAISFLVFTSFGVVGFVFHYHVTMTRNFFTLFGISTILMLVFNGYLTARPVVLYEKVFLSGYCIGTIPIEDFFYGYSLILLNLLLYEDLKKMKNG